MSYFQFVLPELKNYGKPGYKEQQSAPLWR